MRTTTTNIMSAQPVTRTSTVTYTTSGADVQLTAIRNMVDDMWSQYDTDKSGLLNKAEASRMIENTMLAFPNQFGNN